MARIYVKSHIRSLLSLVAVALLCYAIFLFSAQVFYWLKDGAWTELPPQFFFTEGAGHKIARFLPYLGHWDWISSPNSLSLLHKIVSFISIPVYVFLGSVMVAIVVEKN